MIDGAKFWPMWQRICKRFGRTADKSEAADYLEYLDSFGLTTEEAVAEARQVWATREFFPRPADFLQGEAAHGWSTICEFADRWSTYMSADDARILLAAVPLRAKLAIESLGGFDIVRKSRDLPRLRRDYFAAFDSAIMEASVIPRLLAPENVKNLPVDMRDALGDRHTIDPTPPGKIDVKLLKELAGVTDAG